MCKRVKESQNSQDVKKVWLSLLIHKLLPELKYLNIHELKAEHLSYLSDSFVQISSFHKPDNEEKEGVFLSDADLQKVVDFIPKLSEHAKGEFFSFRFDDMIRMNASF